jgi:predicted secreted hydrolase
MRGWRVSAIAVALAFGGAANGAGPTPDPRVLEGNRPAAGFPQVLEPRTFEFPQDHGPHPDFREEWWYVTGNLDATTGERFGFELTIFRFALAPTAPQSGGSRWRTRQVYLAHFAITDVGRDRFRFAQKLSRGALGLAGAEAPPLRVWIDDWSLGVAPASSDGHWSLRAAQSGYELSLDAQPLLPPVLNGDQGLSRKSNEPGSASYYYSIPRVAVRGRLVRDGQPVDVQGLAWLDREWGSGGLGSNEQGWDWFALQLRDGGTLMFYALRNRDGSRDPNSAGTWVDATGQSRALSNGEVQIDVGDHWTNARGERYPSRWHVRVPTVGLDVDVRPVIANQELGTAPRYWEGAVDVSGSRSGQKIDGRGYVELVGYARAGEGAAVAGNGARGTGR